MPPYRAKKSVKCRQGLKAKKLLKIPLYKAKKFVLRQPRQKFPEQNIAV
jgi:hypothetical protein